MGFVSNKDYIPEFAVYEEPNEAVKIKSITTRIPPVTGTQFNPGQTIRLEFPSQGYLNPVRTTLEFSVTLFGAQVTTAGVLGTAINTYSIECPQIRFQNNIQSIFERVRIMYGSTPLEDLLDYNQIVRCKTEWYKPDCVSTMNQFSVAEGIGGTLNAVANVTGAGTTRQSVRSRFIQGLCGTVDNAFTGGLVRDGSNVPNAVGGISCLSNTIGTWACTRTYQITLDGSGLMTQTKLIPLKWMASQLTIELTLADPKNCIMIGGGGIVNLTSNAIGTGVRPIFAPLAPTYRVFDVVLKPEILEMSPSYDQMFLKVVSERGGVTLKFNSWNTYHYPGIGGSTCRLNVKDRSKSIRHMICIQRYQAPTYIFDMHGSVNGSGPETFLSSYQWKVGNTYYPQYPIVGYLANAPTITNGGVEAYTSLKNMMLRNDLYASQSNISIVNWGLINDLPSNLLLDYSAQLRGYQDNGDSNLTIPAQNVAGEMASSTFAASVDLEASHGLELGGFDAETIDDIAFIGQYSGNQSILYEFMVMVNYDAQIVLLSDNVLKLIR